MGQRESWTKQFDNLTRAFSGAFLFGTPLLYTMELWRISNYADLWKLLVFLAIALIANLGLTYFAGFEDGERTLLRVVIQTVEVLAVGLVAAVTFLLVLHRITLTEPLVSILSTVIVESVPLSMGASIANSIFSGKSRSVSSSKGDPWRVTAQDMGSTLVGAVFFGISIAPTREVPLLAEDLNYVHTLALVAFSLVLTYAIVFESGFNPHRSQQRSQALFRRPLTETLAAYLVSLLAALLLLYLFGQIEIGDPVSSWIPLTLVLGLATSVGGAAGRVVV